jgi:hypothetical protein
MIHAGEKIKAPNPYKTVEAKVHRMPVDRDFLLRRPKKKNNHKAAGQAKRRTKDLSCYLLPWCAFVVNFLSPLSVCLDKSAC